MNIIHMLSSIKNIGNYLHIIIEVSFILNQYENSNEAIYNYLKFLPRRFFLLNFRVYKLGNNLNCILFAKQIFI